MHLPFSDLKCLVAYSLFCPFAWQAYQRHLTNNGKDGSALDATIQMIEDHTSSVIEFFSTSRESVMSKDDSRIKNLVVSYSSSLIGKRRQHLNSSFPASFG